MPGKSTSRPMVTCGSAAVSVTACAETTGPAVRATVPEPSSEPAQRPVVAATNTATPPSEVGTMPGPVSVCPTRTRPFGAVRPTAAEATAPGAARTEVVTGVLKDSSQKSAAQVYCARRNKVIRANNA